MPVRTLLPLRPLALRAAALYLVLRTMLMVVSAMLLALGGDPVDNPAGIVLLTAALGAADVFRRHETLLWANLGYRVPVISTLFAAVAATFELAWIVL